MFVLLGKQIRATMYVNIGFLTVANVAGRYLGETCERWLAEIALATCKGVFPFLTPPRSSPANAPS